MPTSVPAMHMNLTYVKQNINNAVLQGVKAMPAKDITSDGTGSFAINRHAFAETVDPTQTPHKRWYGGQANRDASQTATQRRVYQIGLGSMNAAAGNFSFTSHTEKNTVNDALARVRGSGSVVPPKVTHKKTNAPVAHWQPLRTMNPIKDMTPPSKSHRYLKHFKLPIGPRPPGWSREHLSHGTM
jgi:hypothetical protein